MYLILYDPGHELTFEKTSRLLKKAIKEARIDLFDEEQQLLLGSYDPHVRGYVQVFERDSNFFCQECGAESYGYGFSFCPACHVPLLNRSLASQGSKMRFEWRKRI